MLVGHGPKTSRPIGSLPVFSVKDEEEAEQLLVLACPTNNNGDFVAVELAEEQTMDNLRAFSDRLEELYDRYVRKE